MLEPKTSEVRSRRLLIAGTGSGVGKTSISLALARSLSRHGAAVQPYKVGPDYLDPTYLTLAAGRTCYNLDTWMCGRDYVRQLVSRTSQESDIIVIEGAMGLFDGSDVTSNDGSAAEVATLLDAAVILVCDASGQARSFAATVGGFCTFDSGLSVTGVIANYCGSSRHAELLAQALDACGLPPLVGGINKGAMPALANRHLGLVSASSVDAVEQTLDTMADVLEAQVSTDALLSSSRTMPSAQRVEAYVARRRATSRLRLGVAKDAAFHFYYPDNLEALEDGGFDIVPFSPLEDRTLPNDLDALYIGGGYPELFAEQLAMNRDLAASIQSFCRTDRPVYSECGGLMYLSQGILTEAGTHYPMVGLLPGTCRMLPRIKTLGYAEVTLRRDSLWGRAGTRLRGHEFHYSELLSRPDRAREWNAAYDVSFRRSAEPVREGYQHGNHLLSYVHLHLAANPLCIDHFADQCRRAAA